MKQPKEIINVGQLELRFLLDAEDTGNQMVLFESVFPGGAKVAAPPHYHQHVDEMVYGHEGILTVTLDGKKIEVGPGESCFIPRGVIHHHQNTGETVKALGLITPALIDPSYFREISELFKTGIVPDLNKVRETMLRNDTVPVIHDDIHNIERIGTQQVM
jgi:quercetin dioxygenase-like cupin family protein